MSIYRVRFLTTGNYSGSIGSILYKRQGDILTVIGKRTYRLGNLQLRIMQVLWNTRRPR